MSIYEIAKFYPPEELAEKAKPIFKQQKELLLSILPENTDIQHVGSAAIPGAWGKFDIDINIRTSYGNFIKILEILKNYYEEKHPNIWTDSLAIFMTDKPAAIDILVTVIDSKYDDFYRVRDELIKNPALLAQYNELKKQYEGKPYAEYSAAKKEFLGSNGGVRFLKYKN